MLPIPPEELRVWVGPFGDAKLYRASGNSNLQSIIDLCGLKPHAQVLEVGCGCGRIATALASYLADSGGYDGFDVAAPLINWCREEMQPRLPRFRFHLADEVKAPGHNPSGTKSAAEFMFPYPSSGFNLVILSSVLTHILPEAIENYLRETARVLQPGAPAFISMFLFDAAAANAVNSQTTIVDFRHRIGSCLTFDPVHPEEGIACEEAWFLEAVNRAGLRLSTVRRGDWRTVRSYLITQDYVVATKV
jgi:ubiquinone/menaquinone biosynthesis C-methylase UbiE